MDLAVLLQGMLIGLSIAAPVGPIGVLIIRRTLLQGRLAGFVTGLGAASADACYGLVAGLGLTVVTALLVEQEFWLRLLGGLFIAYLGIGSLLSKPAQSTQHEVRSGLFAAYFTTFLLTLTNPMTILSFSGIMLGLGVYQGGSSLLSLFLFVGGVFLGSALWWFILTFLLRLLPIHGNTRVLKWVNRGSGVVLLCFALFVLKDVLFSIISYV